MSASDRSSSDEEEDLDHDQVLLGFLEQPPENTALLRHRFRSKVGGRPAWLNPNDLPTASQLLCSVTKEPLHFLLQVYAPVDKEPSAFHRVVFVFVSSEGSKLTIPGAVKAFRCQLPLQNEFYKDVPDSGDLPPPVKSQPPSDPWQVAEAEAALRSNSGPAGEPGCTGSLSAHGQLEQDPQTARERFADLEGMQTFTEHELVVEAEEAPSDQDKAGMLAQQGLADATAARQGALDAESQEMMDSVEAQAPLQQHAFARFAARVAWAPAQVLRYSFSLAAKPLWPSAEGQPSQGCIPRCPHCGSCRHFEFQVMPQLLNYLGVDSSSDAGPDWGTIAVYSCPASCQTLSAYTEEFVWVQAS